MTPARCPSCSLLPGACACEEHREALDERERHEERLLSARLEATLLRTDLAAERAAHAATSQRLLDMGALVDRLESELHLERFAAADLWHRIRRRILARCTPRRSANG